MTAACDSGRMLGAENSLTPIARSLIELGRDIVSLLLMVEVCEIIHARECVRMIFPQRLLSPSQRSSMHLLRFHVLPLILQHQC